MRLSNGERADDPLGRFREGWRLKARRAKDTWTSGTEPIETAMEGTFLDRVKFAAEFLDDSRPPSRSRRKKIEPSPRSPQGLLRHRRLSARARGSLLADCPPGSRRQRDRSVRGAATSINALRALS